MAGSKKKGGRVAVLVALHLLLGLVSLADVASKQAALSEPLSLAFFVCYFIVLLILGVYAIGWQQIIKRMPLSSAYANKAVTIIWGIFWGAVLFGEAVTPGKIAGALIIMAGIVLYALSDTYEEEDGGPRDGADSAESAKDAEGEKGAEGAGDAR